MLARNSCSRTVKDFVIGLVARITTRITTGHQGNRLSITSHQRPTPRRRPAPWLTWTNVLAALVPAWSVTTGSVLLLSVAVSLAPMWDRAIFVKSLLGALNTNPALMQGQ
jgi:hypothetical protein